MTTTDPRAWLAEAQERASKATEGPWYGAAGNHYVYGVTPGDEVGRFNRPADARFAQHARTDHPAMAAALTAVLDMGPSIIETGGEEDPNFATGYNSGYEDALADIRTAITAHLAQSERH